MALGPQTIINLLIWLVIFPAVSGIVPSEFIKKRDKSLAEIYLCGLFLMFAVFEVCAVPCILLHKSLVFLTVTVMMVMTVFCIASVIIITYAFASRTINTYFRLSSFEGFRFADAAVWLVFGVVFALQLFLSLFAARSYSDDAAWIADAVAASSGGEMYTVYPFTGMPGGHLLRDIVSPYPMFIATLSNVSGLHVLIIAHTVMPVFLGIVSCIIYKEIAIRLFEGNIRKIPVFMMIMSMINLLGGYSEYTREVYQGIFAECSEGLTAGIFVLYAFLILCTISQRYSAGNDDSVYESMNGLGVMLFILNTAAALIGTETVFIMLFMELILVALLALRAKRPIMILKWVLSAIPGIACMMFYLT